MKPKGAIIMKNAIQMHTSKTLKLTNVLFILGIGQADHIPNMILR